ncbi:unnamed protein product [Calicophoron daubneyi]|uniref:Cyclin-dependent kinase 5 activator n=1 Tax=Calicophoron daubneyi TaxID=300641 RepID=A0AAV2TSB0_CALDB
MHQKNLYEELNEKFTASTAGNGSTVRLDQTLRLKSKSAVCDSLSTMSTFGLKRFFFPGLSRKSKISTSDVEKIPQRSCSQSRETKNSNWRESPSNRPETDRFSSLPSSSKAKHKLDTFSPCRCNNLFISKREGISLNSINSKDIQLNSRRLRSTRGGRSGSFNGPFRNGTPYFRPQEIVRPVCNACRHLSTSLYPSSPSGAKPSRNEVRLSAVMDFDGQEGPQLRHVHFNKKRQLSEPNASIQRRHSHGSAQEDDDDHVDLNCKACDIKSNLRSFTSELDQLSVNVLCGNRSNKATPYFHRPPPTYLSLTSNDSRIFREPNEASSSHAVAQLTPVTVPDNIETVSPIIHSCPYHLDFYPYSFSELSLTTAHDNYPEFPIQSGLGFRQSRSSVQASPAHQTLRLIEECMEPSNSTSDNIHLSTNTKFTEINETLDEQSDHTKNGRYKSLTKSISCYALKIFNHHSVQPRLKSVGKSEINLSCAPLRPKERSKKKAVDKVCVRNRSVRSVKLSSSANLQDPSEISQGCLDSTHSTGNRTEPSEKPKIVWYDTHREQLSRQNTKPPSTVVYTTQNRGQYGPKEDDDEARNANVRNITHKSVSQPNHHHLSTTEKTQTNSTPTLLRSSYPHSKFRPEAEPFQVWMSKEGQGGSLYTTLVPVDPRHTVFKAGTTELLRCLSFFVVARLQVTSFSSANKTYTGSRLRAVQPSTIVGWIKAIDRALLLQGWSELAFINPAHVVFLFMLLKDCMEHEINSERELHTIVMACLYLSYSYMGNEISYPLKPFLVAETNQLLIHHEGIDRRLFEGENALINGYESSIRGRVIDQVRNRFWQYCLQIINSKSAEMLQINANPMRFTELFSELRSYDSLVVSFNAPVRLITTPNLSNNTPWTRPN